MKKKGIGLAAALLLLVGLTACFAEQNSMGEAPALMAAPIETATPMPVETEMLAPVGTATAATPIEEPALNRYEASFLDLFDTYSQIVLYCESKEQATQLAQRVHDELLVYHQLYDIYNAYDGVTNLFEVNRRAAEGPVEVEPRLIKLLSFGKEAYALTDGRVNIAMGSVLRIWHQYREAGIDDPYTAKLPPMDELTAAAAHTRMDDLVLDAEANTVFFADSLLQLDVGAVAKGYAVERVAEILEASGVRHALLSIGGNVRAIGNRADGTDFRVAVQNPDLSSPQQSVATLRLNGLSLVSSGSYQRYYTVDGKVYHHIIDPDTLMPSEHFWAVSVVTRDSGLADALSTALYNLPLDRGKALAESLPGVEALWVLHDGSMEETEGFAALLAQ